MKNGSLNTLITLKEPRENGGKPEYSGRGKTSRLNLLTDNECSIFTVKCPGMFFSVIFH